MNPGSPHGSDDRSNGVKTSPTDDDLREVRVVAENSARYFGAKPHELDEVVQRTLIKVWSQWDTPHMARARRRRGVRWAAYIRRIAKHTHLDLVRSNGRRLQRDTLAAGLPQNGQPRPGTMRPNDSEAVNEIDAILGRNEIVALFDQLPERQRMVAQLVMVDELTAAEIGQQFDWDPQAVRKALRGAKEKLKELIRQQLSEHEADSDA